MINNPGVDPTAAMHTIWVHTPRMHRHIRITLLFPLGPVSTSGCRWPALFSSALVWESVLFAPTPFVDQVGASMHGAWMGGSFRHRWGQS